MGSNLPPDAKPFGSYPELDIEVIIVGTGLAGLTAAIECHRKGMRVRMFERMPTINTAGDMFFMGLSSTRFFKHWPEMQEELDAISLHNTWLETFKHSGEQMIHPMLVSTRLKAAGLDPKTPPGSFQMRPLIYKMFINQVEKLGIKIEFNQRVVDYFEKAETGKGGIMTENGDKFEADLVIAADGVGSKSQKLVGGQVRAMQSGRAMWRAAFPIEHLDQNPEVREFFRMHDGKDPIIRTFLGPAAYALTLTKSDTIIWIINHNVDSNGSEAESWNNFIDKAEVLQNIDNTNPSSPWAPIFKSLIACTPPNTIINFNLLWRNPQASWCSPEGRVIQIGDSAHSFLPASGNGATQAIEDGISLASCVQLSSVRDNNNNNHDNNNNNNTSSSSSIPDAVRAHIRLRFVRNACAQKIGFSNAELLQDTDWKAAKLDPKKATPRMPRWIWSHDPEIYTEENFGKAVESMREGVRLEDEMSFAPNYPPGYRYVPWTIDDIVRDKREGVETYLGEGDWE